jgi:hypothetical protein
MDLLDECGTPIDGLNCGDTFQTPWVSGWLDAGALLNGEDPASRFNGP